MGAARVFGYVAGLLLLLLGVAGFLVTGFQGWVEPHPDAVVLGVSLNPTQNLVHLALGSGLLLAATARATVATLGTVVVGALLLVLAAVGVWVAGRPDANVLGVDAGANLLHAVVGGVGIVLRSLAWRRTERTPAEGGRRR